LNGLAALARLQQAMGHAESALAAIEEIRQAAAQLNVPFAQAQVAGIEADIQMKQGNIILVERWAETAVLSPNDTPNAFREQEYFTFAHLLLAQNRLDEAQTLLANFEHFARESGRYRSLISVHLLQAQAAQALGQKEAAVAKLELAVRMAAPENYQRAFIEDGQPLLHLLSDLRAVAPDFVAQLLAGVQPEPSAQVSPHQTQPLLEPLSQRELEILQLAADGLTNREIAEAAFISIGTVKSHIHHILEKLAVSNRIQAVTRARELGLL
jgi:LuxR family maltose regulon positive regulatory protein